MYKILIVLIVSFSHVAIANELPDFKLPPVSIDELDGAYNVDEIENYCIKNLTETYRSYALDDKFQYYSKEYGLMLIFDISVPETASLGRAICWNPFSAKPTQFIFHTYRLR